MALDQFRPAPELEQYLEERGKGDLLAMVRASSKLARITAVEQPEPLGLGYAALTPEVLDLLRDTQSRKSVSA